MRACLHSCRKTHTLRARVCVCALEIMACMREIERRHHNGVISTLDIMERMAAKRLAGVSTRFLLFAGLFGVGVSVHACFNVFARLFSHRPTGMCSTATHGEYLNIVSVCVCC